MRARTSLSDTVERDRAEVWRAERARCEVSLSEMTRISLSEMTAPSERDKHRGLRLRLSMLTAQARAATTYSQARAVVGRRDGGGGGWGGQATTRRAALIYLSRTSSSSIAPRLQYLRHGDTISISTASLQLQHLYSSSCTETEILSVSPSRRYYQCPVSL